MTTAGSTVASATAQFGPKGAWAWYGPRYVAVTTCAARPREAATSPRSAMVVSVVVAARIWSYRRASPGSEGGSSHATFSWRAARTASHSLAETTPTKSRWRTIRALGMSLIDA